MSSPKPISIKVPKLAPLNLVQTIYSNSVLLLIPQIGKLPTWLNVSLESLSGLPLSGEGLAGSHVSYSLGKPRDDEEHLVQRVFAKRLMNIFSHLYPGKNLVLALGIERTCTKQVLQAVEKYYQTILDESRTNLVY